MSFRTGVLFIIFAIFWSCAQQGSPSGGPRDEDPPVILESSPPNYSTLFVAKKVLITFDEYIVLDNVNQELVVSPPMKEKPEVRLKGKGLLITFNEVLKDSTTYTLNFGNAIKDLHEGNKLLNFEYVFSTGTELDSLSIRGTLKYAEDLSVPEEPITIMLYDDLRDSVPMTEIPLYVGRSDDSGVFSINNLKADTFKIFALKDGNYNLLYDLATEEIAFLDSSLIMNTDFIKSIMQQVPADFSRFETDSSLVEAETAVLVNDTSMMADSSLMVSDSLKREPDYTAIYLEMSLFLEDPETQYITEDSRDDPRKILIAFARPLTDSFNYRFLSGEPGHTMDFLEDFSAEKDSLTLWFRDSIDYNKDTLTLELQYTVKDSMEFYVSRTDTLLMTYRKRVSTKKTKKEPPREKLGIQTLRNKGNLDLNATLNMEFSIPLTGFQDSLVHLWHIPDSIEIPQTFLIRTDSMVPTRASIDTKWEEVSNYHLLVLPGAFSSLYDLEHDTLDITFQTRDSEYYGQILVNLDSVSNPVIIQLTSQNEVVRQQRIYESGLYTFSFLPPRDYGLKFIHDLNDNGKWDTGKYLKKRQPEPVEVPPGKVTVRSNWDHDVSVILKK